MEQAGAAFVVVFVVGELTDGMVETLGVVDGAAGVVEIFGVADIFGIVDGAAAYSLAVDAAPHGRARHIGIFETAQ